MIRALARVFDGVVIVSSIPELNSTDLDCGNRSCKQSKRTTLNAKSGAVGLATPPINILWFRKT